MKIIFLGTPSFAETILQELINSKHKVVGVVCQPDKPVGRKQILEMPPTKVLALKHNIPVFQFKKIRAEGVEPLKNLNADIMITAAYGQILSEEVLNITPFGCLNVHASLLPKYRGSCPINWCLINGEKVTGVTIMKTDVGIDTGDMIYSESVKIDDNETVDTLTNKLSIVGAKALLKTLELIETNKAVFTQQNHAESTYYPMLSKEIAQINFNLTAQEICNFVKGMCVWPVAWFKHRDTQFKVFLAEEYCDEVNGGFKNGQIAISNSKKGLVVKCQKGFIRLREIQAENGKKMEDKNYLNGKKIDVGEILNA